MGPWRAFTFGKDLRCVPAQEKPPEKIDTSAIREEGLETLLLMNLDRIFPGYALHLGPKDLNTWAGADITASDPSGCAHVFEVKFGAPERHMVDQALAYALDLLRERESIPQTFAAQPVVERRQFLAWRIAGFWTGTRADKWVRDGQGDDESKDWQTLKAALASGATTLTPEGCYELADRADQWMTTPRTPPVPTNNLHFHLVLPNPKRIDPAQLQALARLRYRGVRASIWQVNLRLQGEQGGLWIREGWIPPILTKGSGWKPDDKSSPTEVKAEELLAHMANLDPALHRELGVWRSNRFNTVGLGDRWGGPLPAFACQLWWSHEHKALRVRFAAGLNVSPTERDAHKCPLVEGPGF